MKAQTVLTRRHFINTAAKATGALGFAGAAAWAGAEDKKSKFNDVHHVVVVMMENRSFDHMLGWLPGANGRQAGLAYTDAIGAAYSTYPLAPDYQGCGMSDPDHSHEGGLVEYNGGACDGWLRAGANDGFCTATTSSRISPFSARQRRRGRRATIISQRRWRRRIRIGSISMRRRRTGS